LETHLLTELARRGVGIVAFSKKESLADARLSSNAYASPDRLRAIRLHLTITSVANSGR
jgi:hypothetical protein